MNRSQVYTNLLTGLGNQLLSDPDEQNNNQYSLKQGILESIPYLFGNTYSPISNVQQQNYLNKEGNKNGGSMGRIRDIINTTNPFQQNGVSAGLIPGTVQYQQENPQKTTLQEIYNQAMSKTTPSWVTALSNAIPSIAQIGALGATKGAFNQGYVADSLERQKQRQQAYNQLLQQQEQNKVKDFVQMAEKQMGIDRADEDRNYTREQTRIKSAYDKMIADRDWQNKQDLQEQAKEQAEIENKNKADLLELQKSKINAEIKALQNKPAELTPEEKIALKVKEEEALANAKSKREAQQEANKARADYEAFKANIGNLKALSKASGNTITRAFGGVGSIIDSLTGKGGSLTNPNVAMDELLAQLRQSALSASGISGESDDKAQQAKINDIYQRAGIPKNAKSLSPTQVEGIINNIENIYKQRLAGKENLVNSFNDFSATWE